MAHSKPKRLIRKWLCSFAVAAMVFIFVSLAHEVAFACPNCKGSVSQSGAGGMAAGFAYSIAWMLLIPISILSAWAVALRRLFRSAAFRR